MKVVGNFYAYLWPGTTMSEMRMYGNNCNSYMVVDALPGNRHVLVDPGHVVNEVGQNCLERLISEIKRDGFKIGDVGLIINTHAHPDHWGASEAIREMSGAQVTISRGEGEFLKMAGSAMSKVMGTMGVQIPELHPDFYLTEGELRLGKNLVASIILTPGHSQSHISIYWPAEKVLMGGDLIFYGNVGRVDIPGSSAESLKESIERVAELDIEYLLTGHLSGGQGIIKGKEQIKRNFEIIRREIFPYL